MAAAEAATKLVKGSILKVYAGVDHGLTITQRDRFNEEVLGFVKG